MASRPSKYVVIFYREGVVDAVMTDVTKLAAWRRAEGWYQENYLELGSSDFVEIWERGGGKIASSEAGDFS